MPKTMPTAAKMRDMPRVSCRGTWAFDVERRRLGAHSVKRDYASYRTFGDVSKRFVVLAAPAQRFEQFEWPLTP
ncbi:hypothetical protein GCM10027447_02330 [Glycomyces halotolerans]